MTRMMGNWELGCIPKELLLYRVGGKRTPADPYTVKVIERVLRSLHIKNAKKNALLMRRFDLGYVETIVDKIAIGVLMREIIKNNKQYLVFDQTALKRIIWQHVKLQSIVSRRMRNWRNSK